MTTTRAIAAGETSASGAAPARRRLLPEPGVVRVLCAATLVNAVGNGLWATSSAFFLTRSVGLTWWQAGTGLTVAALLSMVISTPMGYLADRRRARNMMTAFLLVQAAVATALTFVGSFAGWLVVSAFGALADSGSASGRNALVGAAVPAPERVRARAYLRATTNVGIAAGAAIAAFGIAADTRAGYTALILGNAASYLVAAVICARAPNPPPLPRPASGPRLVALRDRRFLAFTVVDGLMSMHSVLIQLVVPLWIAAHTSAPRWLVAVLFGINTVIVVFWQVPASRGTESLSGAVRAARSGGVFVALACVLFAGSGGVSAPVAVALLVAGTVAHVLGELRHSAAGWGISFKLAPEHAQAQYQGAHAMGTLFGHMVAPVALTGLIMSGGSAGWLVSAAFFAFLGIAVAPVVGLPQARHRAPQRSGPGRHRMDHRTR